MKGNLEQQAKELLLKMWLSPKKVMCIVGISSVFVTVANIALTMSIHNILH